MRASEIIRVLIAFIFGAFSLFAQGNTSAILGTITDASGAFIPRVAVAVTNVETALATTAMTDDVGNYAVRYLLPGRYREEAEASGFKRVIRQDIVLEMARELRVDVTMEVGGVTESVTITGSAPLVETETGTLSTTVETREVVSLPLLMRDPQVLAILSPGVVQTDTSAAGSIGGVSRVMNGGLIRRDAFLLDGAPNGNQVSGTNEVHGSLFEFFGNDKLNAGNFFTHQRAISRHNQFGGTAGGPIKKNKTFFFR